MDSETTPPLISLRGPEPDSFGSILDTDVCQNGEYKTPSTEIALTDNVESPDNEEPTQNESDEGDNPENNDATHFDDATADNEKANLSDDRIEDHDSEPTFAAPITSDNPPVPKLRVKRKSGRKTSKPVSYLVKNEFAEDDDFVKTSRDNSCSVCGKKFKAQIDFVLHYSKTHLNKNYPCPVCRLVFISEGHLELHTVKIHYDMWTPQQEMIVGSSDTVIIKQEAKNGDNYEDENEFGENDFDQNERTSSPEWEKDAQNEDEEVPLKKLKKVSTKSVSIKKVPREAPPPETECSRCHPEVNFPNKHELRLHIEQQHPEAMIECMVCKLMVYSKEFASHHMVEEDESAFRCDICRQSFAAAQHCILHIQNKHMEGTGYCHICEQFAKDFKAHKLTEHKKPTCKICQKEFTTSKYLVRHMAGHKKTRDLPEKRPKIEDPGEGALPEGIPPGPGTCTECDEECEDLPQHMATTHQKKLVAKAISKQIPVPEGPGTCIFCHEETNNLPKHMDNIHKSTGYWRCGTCDKLFESRNKRRIHAITNHKRGENRSGICDECGQFEEIVIRHKFLVHQIERETPGNCVFCLQDVENLKIHSYEVHATKLPTCCHLCNKSLPGQTALKVHMKLSHAEEPGDEKLQLCNVCGRGFLNRKALSQHLRYGHSTQCFECGLEFRKTGSMNYHRFTKHGVSENMDIITCKDCNKIFCTADQMRRHCEKVHGLGKQSPCHICGKMLTDPGAVKRHIKATHEKPREFSCPLCGKSLITSQRLVTHGKLVHAVKFVKKGKRGGPIEYVVKNPIVPSETLTASS